jgi:signal transduction histidine kinase
MLRVFNNLIKNAQQAIPESRKGIIELILSRWEDTILIEIKDNGVGIDEAIRDKIFSPNFTTKNTGMGLGLALVKTIIENSDGSIRFETISGEGTSFFISLPAYSE